MFRGGIRMPETEFRCPRGHSFTLEAITELLRQRVSGCIEEAFGYQKLNSDAQEGIQIR